jgi:hypothetical protein
LYGIVDSPYELACEFAPGDVQVQQLSDVAKMFWPGFEAMRAVLDDQKKQARSNVPGRTGGDGGEPQRSEAIPILDAGDSADKGAEDLDPNAEEDNPWRAELEADQDFADAWEDFREAQERAAQVHKDSQCVVVGVVALAVCAKRFQYCCGVVRAM